MFSTTHVGSLPRPDYLLRALSEYQESRLSQTEFDDIMNLATHFVVKMQVETGVDEVNDGEYSRLVYFGDITSLPCFSQGLMPLEFSAGDIYRAPLLTGKILYDAKSPLVSKEVRKVKEILKALGVERRVKVTIPSPSHLENFYPNPDSPFLPPYFKPLIKEAHERVRQYYPSADDYLDEIKPILVNEAEEAFKAGADTVQFDSPDLSSLKSSALERAVEVNNSVLSHFPPQKLGLHICWGNYENTQLNTEGSFKDLLPTLYDLKVGTLGPLEIFDGIRDHKEIKTFKEFPPKQSQRICAGIVSAKTRNVEPIEILKERYAMLVEIVGPERAAASPGCGFSSAGTSRIISLESARRKLINLVKAVRQPKL